MDNSTSTTKKRYPEYQHISLPELDKEVLAFWKENQIFEQSISSREGQPEFVFYEGPPSANGQPGIHHVIARTIKDLFCRYKTLKGFQVKRKAGWDTHGLPVELNVEKEMGISKDDIGKKISIEAYNKACREMVGRYKDQWDEVTEQMGYWVDLDDPYVTYKNEYIETCWWLLKQIHEKGMLYKGYTIQPFSPAAGTGLSSHELNMPGTYRSVKDNTIVAQFKVKRDEKSEFLFEAAQGDVFCLAWTTTPWTLPSNTALAVGKNINYFLVNTTNAYTGDPISVVMAEKLLPKLMKPGKDAELTVGGGGKGKIGGKEVEFTIAKAFKGSEIEGVRYEQLLPYAQPENADQAFRVLIGDFVTTDDGTGIVHLAPTFGADDFRVAAQNGVPALLVDYEDGTKGPLVDRRGRFTKEMRDDVFGFAGEYVKGDYLSPEEMKAEYLEQKERLKDLIPNLKGYLNVDERLALKLKLANQAFKIEKYEHDYPHCWRTDKPILYYPLDSWFIRTTAVKDRMVELNKTINWKPASTGTGRFGNWLENMVDWNLSRSRYWGVPLPLWLTEEGDEQKCIGSREELEAEVKKAIAAGFMTEGDWQAFVEADDIHRPYVDNLVLVSDSGKPMRRETDLIDVWFDSGSMPYAQWHYPFENEDRFKAAFPADFIAEGVDQTRGWFYTLHAISVMLFDSIAYKNVLSNGLVLDKNGVKMSKRLGNIIRPSETLPVYGTDPVRWYMVGNAAPWDNLKFNMEILAESKRIYFGTLFNTYFFFAQYANIDGFDYSGPRIPVAERRELDRWIMSKLNTLVRDCDDYLGDYEPHKAVKAMEAFLDELSNWYVRLSRRIFWKGEMTREKEAAYQTLYECLLTLSKLMSPFAPFYSEKLYRDLNGVSNIESFTSVHLSHFPECKTDEMDADLEERMAFAREITSLVHSIRKNPQVNIKVRQPLARVMVPVLSDKMKAQVEAVSDVILSEVNVKELQTISESDDNTVIVKKAKANFRALGPRLGKNMKEAAGQIAQFGNKEIGELEQNGHVMITVAGEPFELRREEVDLRTEDVPGWRVAGNDKVTVALDLTLTDALKQEGLARDVVNRIQNMRKDMGLEVTDRIKVQVVADDAWKPALNQFLAYICTETLADSLEMVPELADGNAIEIDG
ncbi:MAG: isoleucine--tRNA ligase, partial [Bacteroidota bacterium]